MPSVSMIGCKRKPWKNCTSNFKSFIKYFKTMKYMQVTGNTILNSPISYSVRINHEPDGLLKAYLNTVPSIKKNLSCMVLHTIRTDWRSDEAWKWPCKKVELQDYHFSALNSGNSWPSDPKPEPPTPLVYANIYPYGLDTNIPFPSKMKLNFLLFSVICFEFDWDHMMFCHI